jgi:CubicO group peptidase (beta-lactamase class C family)
MYGLLAMGGELDGAQLVSAHTIERFGQYRSTAAAEPWFALGYHLLLGPTYVPSASTAAFGHSGAGGQLAFADPQHRLSFGFVKNQLLHSWQTARDLAEAVYSCL